ncbi:Dihydropteroate synthase [Candidatus Erwinia haradaeae]|uniref:Dihydropteroate synthase n=1 Tax=Candidatus Erwinia haradaeae TaxID=1922217 RepID=A0A451D0B7_9GAMM|nr:dihydropteroate synthase [Candidatus Erwinia haradaeae]VFP78872.1 Dihydropteroate synthase [Candidatus Erwinia haradaeae]
MKLWARDVMLDLTHSHVMGILNMTPDSFFDGGKNHVLPEVITYVERMIDAGATIIDIGGESTRPYALKVSIEEELERVIPIIEGIAQRFSVWISIDTSKPEVMHEAAHSGAHMINDIRSLRSPGALAMVERLGLPVCLVHMQGEPHNMQDNPFYYDVLNDVEAFFIENIARCEAVGIKKVQLILDPGFGFGKSIIHNYQLLGQLERLHHFGLPLLVGMSRKSMIFDLLSVSSLNSLNGSLACAVIAALQGVHIFRVHDVKETIEVLRIVEMMRAVNGRDM